jgi:hypothetical protein
VGSPRRIYAGSAWHLTDLRPTGRVTPDTMAKAISSSAVFRWELDAMIRRLRSTWVGCEVTYEGGGVSVLNRTADLSSASPGYSPQTRTGPLESEAARTCQSIHHCHHATNQPRLELGWPRLKEGPSGLPQFSSE